jgi:hypothetical protein
MTVKPGHTNISVPHTVNTAITIAPAEYPFIDPIFQKFTAQQYIGLGTGLTYSTKPAESPKPETDVQRKARFGKETTGNPGA